MRRAANLVKLLVVSLAILASTASTAHAAPEDDAAIGALGRRLLGQIANAACDLGAGTSLTSTCAAARESSLAPSTLRAAALADALALAGGADLSPAGRELGSESLPESELGARWRDLARAHGVSDELAAASLARATAALKAAREARARFASARGSARTEAALAVVEASLALWREIAVIEGSVLPVVPPTAERENARALLLRIIALETDDDVKALARSLLVPLPPWTDGVLFDANASLPVLGSETFLDGDLLLGYSADRFGGLAFGSVHHHAFDTPQGQRTVIDRYEGRAEGVWSPALGEDVRLELRLRGGVILYDASTSGRFVIGTGTGTVRPDETSLVGHGGASVGLRARAGSRLAFSVSAGGGVQVEDFSAVDATGASLILLDASPVAARGEGRLRAQWNAAPSYLSFRVRADGNILSLSNVKATTTAGAATGIATMREVQESRQVELFTRVFVDLDALAFFGFRPSAHVGVDLFVSDAFSNVVPVLGAGFRRESF